MARLAPWLLLALLFLLPGVYLEYPADPWEHYRRINEWMTRDVVEGFSAGYKSSYFFAYSLLGRISPPLRQLFWLDFYYAGCCVLLCWQYFRLARAVGLGERVSFIFVLIQALTFGNNIFGFYRYYGISSSIFAQLGAVALVRIAIEVAKGPLALRFKPKALSAAPCAACLLALTAFNHIQGLGIAGLGIWAVVVWRLIEWRRSMLWWLAATAIVLSVAAVLWWPRNPTLDRDYVPQGWFTAWYGFNLLSPSSPAFDRTTAILGFFGIMNFLAGLLLLRRNHVAAWLTITPLFALCLPFFVILFANAVALHSVTEILTFHRMLLAIPSGLAIVCLGVEIADWKCQVSSTKGQNSSERVPSVESTQKETKGTEREASGTAVGGGTAPLSSLPAVDQSAPTNEHESARIGSTPLSPLPSVKCLQESAEREVKPAELGHEDAQKDTIKIVPFLVRFGAFLWPKASAQPTAYGGIAPLSPLPSVRSERGKQGLPAYRLALAVSRLFTPFPLLLLTLAALLAVPANSLSYNRLYNAISVSPTDLSMRHVIEASRFVPTNGGFDIATPKDHNTPQSTGSMWPLTTPSIGFVLESTGRVWSPVAVKGMMGTSPSFTTGMILEHLGDVSPNENYVLVFWSNDSLYTPYSLAGFLSGHWLPNEVALDHSTQEELLKPPTIPGLPRSPPRLWLDWSSDKGKTHHFGGASGARLRSLVEDRGNMNSQGEYKDPTIDDQITLSALLGFPDRNCWRVSISMTGPDSFHRSHDEVHEPSLLGHDDWIYCDLTARFVKPGQYAIEVTSEAVWPAQTYTVRYTLTVADSNLGNR